MKRVAAAITAWAICTAAWAQPPPPSLAKNVQRDPYGAVVRGEVSQKKLALIFTGDEFGESTSHILDALKARNLRGSFFVTGNFLRREEFQPLVRRIVEEGHYLGPHSDDHPLYCDWEDRERNLVTEEEFTADLRKNLAGLRQAGAPPAGTATYFVAPYEWYNGDQVRWARKLGVELVNFTPGSGSNRDYAKEGHERFVPSRKIYEGVLAYEQRDPHGLNGFLLLMHLGSGRKDPLHAWLGRLSDELADRGYELVRIDELIGVSQTVRPTGAAKSQGRNARREPLP